MLKLYDAEIASRLLLGTARYPSPAMLAEAVRRSKTDIVTVSLRRETAGGKSGGGFFRQSAAMRVDRHVGTPKLQPQRKSRGRLAGSEHACHLPPVSGRFAERTLQQRAAVKQFRAMDPRQARHFLGTQQDPACSEKFPVITCDDESPPVMLDLFGPRPQIHGGRASLEFLPIIC